MIISPKVSLQFQKQHRGEVIISFEGKVIGVGKDAIIALRRAKKAMPTIEQQEFLISRIHHNSIAV